MISSLLPKKILLMLTFLIIFPFISNAQVTPVWEKSVTGANLPLWFGTDTERGIAYGTVGGNERIYVVSRKTTPAAIIILNAATGDSVGTLDVTGIAGGLYTLNDVEVSNDGVIFACNMTTSASGAGNPFKVYKWTSEASTPVEVLSYNVGAYRMGDKFTVVGSLSDNSITIYAAVAANNKVLRFRTTDGITFTFTELVATGLTGNTPAVDAAGPGVANIFVNSNGISPKEYSTTDSATTTALGTMFGDYCQTGSNSLRYFTANGRKYIAVYLYGTGFNLFRVIDITSGIGSVNNYIAGQSPTMGSATNTNGTGDIDIKDNGNGTFTFCVLGTNNGIGLYNYTPPAPYVVPMASIQDFEGTFPPLNYVRTNGFIGTAFTNSSSWAQDDFANIVAPINKSAKNNVYGTSRKDWLITPTFDLGAGSTDYQLEFDIALTKYAALTADTLGVDDTVAVFISTDNGITWDTANALQVWTQSTLISNTGEHHVYDLSAYSGLVRFGFYAKSSVSNKDNDLFIDNIQVREIPVLPIISVNPPSHNYGGLQIGTSLQKSFTITNSGVGTLTISSAVLANGGNYVKVDSAVYPVNLTNQQSYSLGINFSPVTVGEKLDTLKITSNLGVYDVPLTGTGFDATVNVFPFTESFDSTLFPPQGWLNVQVTGAGLFERVTAGVNPTTTPHSGAAMLQYKSYSYSVGTSAAFISPILNFAAPNYTVKFWMNRDNGYLTNVDRITVYINDSPSLTGADSIGGVYRSINLFPAVSATGWYEYTFIVPGGGNKHIILKAYSAYGNNMFIDDFSISVTPAIEYAAASLIQINGIPTPFDKMVADNYMIKGKEETVFNPAGLQSSRSSDVVNSGFQARRVESNLVISDAVYPPNVPINLRTIISNFGYTSPAYQLQWSVDGSAGAPFDRPGIPVMSSDTILINTTPLNRGTLTSIVNAVVTGDTIANNQAALYRTYVYPDSAVRTRYDNGTHLPSTFIGFNDSLISTYAAVRFKAAQNIQIANVDAFYRNENSIDSVEVQIRAAGVDSLAPGAVLYSKKFSGINYSSVNGSYFSLPMGTDAPGFLANEDYWIVLKTKGAKFPFGAQSTGITTGHSFVTDADTIWYPLVISTTEYAWLIRSVGVPYTPPPPPPTYTLWERTSANGNLPSWFSSTSTERGMAWGRVFDNSRSVVGRVFVVSRNGGTFVKVLDDSTGADAGELNVTGIAGGTFILNDAEVSSDGKIFAANLATLPGAFKVYMWDSLTSVPQTVIEFTTGITGDRLGDKFTVVGSYSAGTAAIYAANGTAGAGRVYKWTMTGGTFNPVPEVIALSDNITGSTPAVGPCWDGSFFFNANGINPKKYSANGTLLGTIPGTVVATGSNAIRSLGVIDTIEYFVTFQYGTGNNNARLAGFPLNNYAGAFTFGITPTMGSVANGNGTGDVAVKHHPDGSVTVFVMTTNNGVGAYRTNYAVPVELTSLAAKVNDRSVEISWSTATESNSHLFQVERSSADDQNWTTVASINAAGSSSEKHDYLFIDKNLNTGNYIYRLKMIDLDGTYKYSSAIEAEIGVPVEFSLSQNYPNPFNPTTRINYQIPVDAKVTIEMFDITGQRVATLVNQDLQAGYHTLEVSGLRLASGMYIYRMTAVSAVDGRNFMDVKKMMMLK